jgi:putative FmdB family regulatory protein
LPIYQYRCTRCFHQFELRQSFDDDAELACPRCGADARRIFSPVPVIFKGSGFYTTDNRKGNETSEEEEPKGDKTAASTRKEEDKK